MYAIVKSGGKQYRVEEDSTIVVDHIQAEVGDEVVIKDVLLINRDGETIVGTPRVHGARVVAKVVRQFKDEKVEGFTYKPKKNVARRYGHRQMLTELSVEKIEIEK
ncbi:MAG: 50S ribosomal protein L21 [Armatimonadota bacterium]|nr:50S ribosomal protein L21 [Armatimonadota bacterium]